MWTTPYAAMKKEREIKYKLSTPNWQNMKA